MSLARQFHPRRRSQRQRSLFTDALIVFVVVLAGALFVSAPGDPVAGMVERFRPAPVVDQHFRNCNEARAAGRENIPSWDPSYRASMDGDDDGLACEPRRYSSRNG